MGARDSVPGPDERTDRVDSSLRASRFRAALRLVDGVQEPAEGTREKRLWEADFSEAVAFVDDDDAPREQETNVYTWGRIAGTDDDRYNSRRWSEHVYFKNVPRSLDCELDPERLEFDAAGMAAHFQNLGERYGVASVRVGRLRHDPPADGFASGFDLCGGVSHLQLAPRRGGVRLLVGKLLKGDQCEEASSPGGGNLRVGPPEAEGFGRVHVRWPGAAFTDGAGPEQAPIPIAFLTTGCVGSVWPFARKNRLPAFDSSRDPAPAVLVCGGLCDVAVVRWIAASTTAARFLPETRSSRPVAPEVLFAEHLLERSNADELEEDLFGIWLRNPLQAAAAFCDPPS